MIAKIKKIEGIEWHLFSATAITASLTFISVVITTGTPQVVAVAFSAIVGMFLFASNNWKNTGSLVHKWCIVFSLVILTFSIVMQLNQKNNK